MSMDIFAASAPACLPAGARGARQTIEDCLQTGGGGKPPPYTISIISASPLRMLSS